MFGIVKVPAVVAAMLVASTGTGMAQTAYPAQSTSDTFKVFFDRGMSKMSGTASGVVDDIIARLKARPYRSISIEGHVDTFLRGAAALKLSRAMAANVRLYLVKHGVKPTLIKATGYGSTKPAIATGPHVVEPLNRFVGITISWQ